MLDGRKALTMTLLQLLDEVSRSYSNNEADVRRMSLAGADALITTCRTLRQDDVNVLQQRNDIRISSLLGAGRVSVAFKLSHAIMQSHAMLLHTGDHRHKLQLLPMHEHAAVVRVLLLCAGLQKRQALDSHMLFVPKSSGAASALGSSAPVRLHPDVHSSTYDAEGNMSTILSSERLLADHDLIERPASPAQTLGILDSEYENNTNCAESGNLSNLHFDNSVSTLSVHEHDASSASSYASSAFGSPTLFAASSSNAKSDAELRSNNAPSNLEQSRAEEILEESHDLLVTHDESQRKVRQSSFRHAQYVTAWNKAAAVPKAKPRPLSKWPNIPSAPLYGLNSSTILVASQKDLCARPLLRRTDHSGSSMLRVLRDDAIARLAREAICGQQKQLLRLEALASIHAPSLSTRWHNACNSCSVLRTIKSIGLLRWRLEYIAAQLEHRHHSIDRGCASALRHILRRHDAAINALESNIERRRVQERYGSTSSLSILCVRREGVQSYDQYLAI